MSDKNKNEFDKQFGIDPQSHILGQHRNIPDTIDWSKLIERGSQEQDPNKKPTTMLGFVNEQHSNTDQKPNN